jgi:hypothetical protein
MPRSRRQPEPPIYTFRVRILDSPSRLRISSGLPPVIIWRPK